MKWNGSTSVCVHLGSHQSDSEEEQDGGGDADCCVSANMDLWLTALYAYKGPLLVSEHITQ